MLSRVAEAIYWMNRYVERAENIARFLDVSLGMSLDLPDGHPEPWAALVGATGDDELFRRSYGEATRASVVAFLTFDRAYPNSILSCFRMARDNARSVRESLSTECWEQVNKAFLLVSDAANGGSSLEVPHAFYAAVKHAAQLLLGMQYVTMTHDEGWHFGRVGRLMERADKTSRILDVKYFILEPTRRASANDEVARTYEEIQWVALLRCASGLQAYRRRHGLVDPVKVVDFLLFEPKFPRSVRYCLSKSERSIEAISRVAKSAGNTPAEKAFARARARFERESTDVILAGGLHKFVDELQGALNDVGDAVQDQFFAISRSAESERALENDEATGGDEVTGGEGSSSTQKQEQ